MSLPYPSLTDTFHHAVYPAIDPTNPALSAKGKVVVVTGGGRGLGKAIATSFAIARAKAIVLLGRTVSTLEAAKVEILSTVKPAGQELSIHCFGVDVCDSTSVNTTLKGIRDEVGPVDIFINNAGDFFLGTIEESDIDDYWRSVEINLKGPLNAAQALLRYGMDKDSPKNTTFINLTSIGVHMPYYPNGSTYAVSKLAASKLMEYLRVEAGEKLRVFDIHPGTIMTDMAVKAGIQAFDEKELPGGVCVWLAATLEANFLCGRLIHCNWDVGELLQKKETIVENDLLTMRLAGYPRGKNIMA